MGNWISNAKADYEKFYSTGDKDYLENAKVQALISIADSLSEIEGALLSLADEDHSFLTRSKN